MTGRRLLAALLCVVPACDDATPMGEALPTCAGAKCDTAEDGFEGCKTAAEMIEAARETTRALIYDRTKFDDGIAGVDRIEDINSDGFDDALVRPGVSFGGAKVDFLIYLSNAKPDESEKNARCPEAYAGHFGAAVVSVPADETNAGRKVKDLLGTTVVNCDAEEVRYRYNGSSYRRGERSMKRVCDPPTCPDERDLVDAARRHLLEPEDTQFELDDFLEARAKIETIDDLDGDGTPDTLVFPGLDYADGNKEIVIMLSRHWSCADQYAGHIAGVAIAKDSGTSEKDVADLMVTSDRDGRKVQTRMEFRDDVYVEVPQ